MSLTQPAVSLQIRQLEELIGQPLFDYVGKKLYMTEAAEALQRASRDIFGRLESLDMQLSDMQGSLQGQLEAGRGIQRQVLRSAPVCRLQAPAPGSQPATHGGQPRPGDSTPVGQPRRPGDHVDGADRTWAWNSCRSWTIPSSPSRRRDHPLCHMDAAAPAGSLQPYALLMRESRAPGTRMACEEYFKEKRVHFNQTLEVSARRSPA